MSIDNHPTVVQIRSQSREHTAPHAVDPDWLKQLARECGADDVGIVPIEHPAIADDRSQILEVFPATKALLSIVCRMNAGPIRSPARSVANLEFHHTGDEVNEIARAIVARLAEHGIAALNPPMGFPMEMDRFPGKIWTVSHKLVAVAAGLGQMGIHRNVIHPKFGNFILLGTILLGSDVNSYDQPIEYNPCLECKLCVAACPVGAIGADGHFDFSACYTHNYREFMGGFTNWAEDVAASSTRTEYRQKVTPSESASLWQSLAFGPNYKAAYCLSVCPAGEEVIGPYLDNKREHLDQIVRPLQQKQEAIYVIPGSDAEAHVQRRFPHKEIRRTRSSLHPRSIDGFLRTMRHVFQREQSAGLDAVYHFRFTGAEPAEATVRIVDQQLEVLAGLVGTPNLRITVDAKAWLRFLAQEIGLVRLMVFGRFRFWGDLRLLAKFGKCFPA
jgi:epoxyqueuosine reductase QueG